jgi:hypothetical protein
VSDEILMISQGGPSPYAAVQCLHIFKPPYQVPSGDCSRATHAKYEGNALGYDRFVFFALITVIRLILFKLY